MLKYLQIRNYALIDNLEVEFNEGFTVLTGETGAGKSIILGALGLILGNRAELSLLKDSSKKCVIEGIFDNSLESDSAIFTENDIDVSHEIILRREILPSGKSRSFINDTPVILKLISEVGNLLVNIHSQHETLQLAKSVFQQEVLDDYLDNGALLSKYKDLLSEYNSAIEQLKILKDETSMASRDEDYLRFQLNELKGVELDEANFAELEEKARILEHSEEIKIAISQADQLLNDDENSISVYLQKMKRIIENIEEYLPDDSKITERLKSVSIELDDIGNELRDATPSEEYSASDLDALLDKISKVYTLLKKHNFSSVKELQQLKSDIEEKLGAIENKDFNIGEAEKRVSVLKDKLQKTGNELHNARILNSNNFEKSVMETLQQLGMKNAGFKVEVTKTNDFMASGIDIIKFMFNANKGVKPGEISKIASGGEISRLMLAIKSLISRKQMLPTVIFDEIDSGVSGDIAGKVGRILKNMSKSHQVIAITHLPQIASKADYHYKVYKIDDDDNTTSTIKALDSDGRVEELSQMLSSENVTDTARNVAREMLSE